MFMNHNLYDLCPHMYVEEPVPSKHSGVQLSTMLLSSLNTSYQNSPQCDPGSSKIERGLPRDSPDSVEPTELPCMYSESIPQDTRPPQS